MNKYETERSMTTMNSSHNSFFVFLMSGAIFAQGNFGINVGLNDDNFGSIKNIKTKIDDYDLDLKNSTGFHLGVFTEIDLITF